MKLPRDELETDPHMMVRGAEDHIQIARWYRVVDSCTFENERIVSNIITYGVLGTTGNDLLLPDAPSPRGPVPRRDAGGDE